MNSHAHRAAAAVFPERPAALILNHRTNAHAQGPLVIQQASLAMSDDGQQVILRRYFEHYSPDGGEWVEYVHSVNTRELMHWMMAHGQFRMECPPQDPTQ